MKKLSLLFLGAMSLNCLLGCSSNQSNNNYSYSYNVTSNVIKDFDGITFKDAYFTYDGQPHSIYVEGAPSFASVTYTNNDQIEVGKYVVDATITADNYHPLSLSAELTIAKGSFAGVSFEDLTVEYDGKSHSIYVSGAPDFAEITYTNNSKADVGTYTVSAKISAPNYETLTKSAKLTINKANMENVSFEDASYLFDGKSHSLTVKNAPSGSSISYRRTNGSGTNTFKDIGVYEVEATITNKNYNTKVLNATLTIMGSSSVISIDESKIPLQLNEPLKWDPIFNKLMEGNYTLLLHSGYWDSGSPDVKHDNSSSTYASDGINLFIDNHVIYDGANHHYFEIYTNCGEDAVYSEVNDYYDTGKTTQFKLPSIALDETAILRPVAKAFVGLNKDENGYIVPGIDLDDYYYSVGRAEVNDDRFVVTLDHPRSLDNGETRTFYTTYEFYNIGNTKIDIPSCYFLSQNEIDALSVYYWDFIIEGVAYGHHLVSTYNSPTEYMAHTYMNYYQFLIVKPGVHFVYPAFYGEAIQRVVYNYYTEDYRTSINLEGYEINLCFDENGNYQGEYAQYGSVTDRTSRFESYGGIVHYYDEWHQ